MSCDVPYLRVGLFKSMGSSGAPSIKGKTGQLICLHTVVGVIPRGTLSPVLCVTSETMCSMRITVYSFEPEHSQHQLLPLVIQVNSSTNIDVAVCAFQDVRCFACTVDSRSLLIADLRRGHSHV